MKISNLYLITFIVVCLYLITAVSSVTAEYGPYGQYEQQPGEEQPYSSPTEPAGSILIDKMVALPGTENTKEGISSNRFVDNLSANDRKFSPNNKVYFRIKVKNTSSITMENVVLRDYIPDFIEPASGPGTYNASTRTITYTIPQISAGEEKIYDFEMQVVSQNRLPSDKSIVCVMNKANISTGKSRDEDSSQLCIEKSVQGLNMVPKTGPELGLLILAGNILGLGAGTYLRRMKS